MNVLSCSGRRMNQLRVVRSPQKRTGDQRRRGASLIELMVVISIISTILGMVGVLFHQMFLTEQSAMRSALVQRNVARLSDQFRKDVHAASNCLDATKEGQAFRMELTKSAGPSSNETGNSKIVYSIRPGEVVRENEVDGKRINIESYWLPDCRVQFVIPNLATDSNGPTAETKPNFVVLKVERKGTTVTPQPQADRPFRTLEIEAVLGRNQRLVRLAVKKKPGVAANGRGQDGVPTYSLSAVQRNSAVATQSGEVTP